MRISMSKSVRMSMSMGMSMEAVQIRVEGMPNLQCRDRISMMRSIMRCILRGRSVVIG